MVLKPDQERVKALLKETITLLCRNGLHFKNHFSIEAVIGVTLDEEEVFLVSVNELISADSRKSSAGEDQQVSPASMASKTNHKRHRKRKAAKTESGGESGEDANGTSDDGSSPDDDIEGGEESGSEANQPSEKRQCQEEGQETVSHAGGSGGDNNEENKGEIQIKEEVDDCVWTNPAAPPPQQLQPTSSNFTTVTTGYTPQIPNLADLPDINMIQAGLVTCQAQWLQQQDLQSTSNMMAMSRTPRTSTVTSAANISQPIEGDSMNISQDTQQMSSPVGGDPFFHCILCGKSFTRKYTWKVHMNLHAGRYSLHCHICNKGFNNSYSLRGHMSNVHTGVKDFKCDVCGKEFGYKHHLKYHMERSHS